MDYICLIWAFSSFLIAVNGYQSRQCTIVKNTQNYTCGLPGSVNSHNPQTGNSVVVQDVDACTQLAFATLDSGLNYPLTRKYFSFSFDNSSSMCTLYHQNFLGFKENKQSTTYFYDWECFECETICPLPLETNLLLNGGFESASNVSLPWRAPRVSEGGYESQYSVGGRFNLNQYVYLCPDYVYKLQFWYKTENIPESSKRNSIQIEYHLNGVFPGPQSDTLYAANTLGNWTLVETYYHVSSDSYYPTTPALLQLKTFYRHRKIPKGATIYVDDIQLYAVEPAEATETNSTSSNILVNGGFETGGESPWTIGTYSYSYPYGNELFASIVSPGISGNYAFNITNEWDTGQYLTAQVHIGQTVYLQPQTSYVLSFDVETILLANQTQGNSLAVFVLASDEHHQKVIDGFEYTSFFAEAGLKNAKIPLISNGEEMSLSMTVYPGEMETLIFDNFELIEASLQGT